MPDNLVLTPGGFRHPSLVHRVEAGHGLHVADGKTRLMNMATKAIIEIPEVALQPGDVPGFGSGWIADAYWRNNTGHPVSSFKTTWRVPPAPATQSGQTIFLFNGIDPTNPSDAILQPVLQWGGSAAGGGNYWSVASWYVLKSGQAFHTTLVQVNAGDMLVGVMTLTGQSGGMFSYTSEFQGIAGTNLPVQNIGVRHESTRHSARSRFDGAGRAAFRPLSGRRRADQRPPFAVWRSKWAACRTHAVRRRRGFAFAAWRCLISGNDALC